MSNENQDLEIHNALQGRKVPEHRSDFFADLATEMEADVASDLVVDVPKGKRRPVFYALPVAAAILAVTAVGVGVTNGFGGSSTPNDQIAGTTTGTPVVTEIRPILASEVIERANTALETITSIGGIIETKTTPPSGSGVGATSTLTEFKKRASGDVWSSSSVNGAAATRSSYSVAKTELRRYTPTENTAELSTGVIDGINSRIVGLDDLDRFTASIVSLNNASDPNVTETTFDARPAWEIQVNGSFDVLGLGPDHWVVTVDQATSVPVRVVGTLKGAPYTDSQVKNLTVNQTFTDAEMTVDIPAGVKPFTFNGPFKNVDVSAVSDTVDYKAFVPSVVPDGFKLSTASVAKDAGAGGPEGMNPDNKNVVVLQYRLGLQSFMVTTRLSATSNEYGWNDPMAAEGAPPGDTENITLKGGAFDGVKAEVLPESKAVPHLWAIGSKYLLTVSGDLDRDGLVGIAQSLQQQ